MLLGNKLDLNEKNIPNSEDEIFDYLLLFWFKEQFQNAYMKGFYRTYRRFEKNDDHLRGTIDIARHIKLNMGQNNGKIAYSYRENTVNNFLNHLIIAAYEHLKRKYSALVMEIFDQDLDLKTAMNTLKNEIGYVDTAEQTLLFKNMKPISHPYYMEYEALRVTCMKILRDTGISFFDGDSEETSHGILFYIPDLWEMYLEREVFQKDFYNQNESENAVDVDNQKKFDGAIAFDNQGEIGIFYNIYNGEKGASCIIQV
jgi:5-methylcytosine-specific restriction endonuclease McrBC regulatory subunit McrC